MCEEGREAREPFLCTGDQIVSRQGISKFLQGLRIGALQEGVGALLGLAGPAHAGAWKHASPPPT
ncbi:MAG TPA: hypothetical protein VE778_00140 [Candidatus Bathyarchaeia archaeon]|nr:hypothetical protein [Candidatus Bathyarchaeia archaeon]